MGGVIISRTPFRISFFGGGTDYPVWYEKNGGAVLSTTINKYCYISCRNLPPFFEHKSRIVWSKIESVKDVDEIQHPTAREILKHLEMVDQGIEIHHDADLPARSGLGSSSAFTVGLLHALYALKGKMIAKRQLALEAIHVEQNRVKENVGSQDQVAAAFGGFNKIEFGGPNHITVSPVTILPERLAELEKHFLLFFTGLSRNASDIASEQIKNTPQKEAELKKMHGMVQQAIDILNDGRDVREFGQLLHEAWQLKRGLSHVITNNTVDQAYDTARRAGAIGGKLLGAGGGGFMLVFAEPEKHPQIKKAMTNYLEVPIRFDHLGSQIVYHSYQEA